MSTSSTLKAPHKDFDTYLIEQVGLKVDQWDPNAAKQHWSREQEVERKVAAMKGGANPNEYDNMCKSYAAAYPFQGTSAPAEAPKEPAWKKQAASPRHKDLTTGIVQNWSGDPTFAQYLDKRVQDYVRDTFPMVARNSMAVVSVAITTVGQMRAGGQRGLLDAATADYVKKYPCPNDFDDPKSAAEDIKWAWEKSHMYGADRAPHPTSKAFGAAFDKMAQAVEETRKAPTRPMKARLAMGLAKFGGVVERTMNKAMAYAVPSMSMFSGTVGALAGGVMGFSAKDPTLMYGSITAGLAVGTGGAMAAKKQADNPNSRFRTMTTGLRDKCEQPFRSIESKAKQQGREWAVTKADLGDPEPKQAETPRAGPWQGVVR
jgi:hypothetical protein